MKKLITAGILLTLAGCGNNDPAQYQVTATNLTAGQPFSPLAVMLHTQNNPVFSLGTAASTGLEMLAESGSNTVFLGEVNSTAEASGSGPIGPGASQTITLESNQLTPNSLRLSVVTMLVNTNDAITAINNIDISGMDVGQSKTFTSISYDAGTEANTETIATIPGPAGSGASGGFNAIRDDINNQITMHSGVITAADGLATSNLGQQHRWDNPVGRFTITRTR